MAILIFLCTGFGVYLIALVLLANYRRTLIAKVADEKRVHDYNELFARMDRAIERNRKHPFP